MNVGARLNDSQKALGFGYPAIRQVIVDRAKHLAQFVILNLWHRWGSVLLRRQDEDEASRQYGGDEANANYQELPIARRLCRDDLNGNRAHDPIGLNERNPRRTRHRTQFAIGLNGNLWRHRLPIGITLLLRRRRRTHAHIATRTRNIARDRLRRLGHARARRIPADGTQLRDRRHRWQHVRFGLFR